jgi:hypothetical protein
MSCLSSLCCSVGCIFSAPFMEPKCSLPYSQQPATCSYPDGAETRVFGVTTCHVLSYTAAGRVISTGGIPSVFRTFAGVNKCGDASILRTSAGKRKSYQVGRLFDYWLATGWTSTGIESQWGWNFPHLFRPSLGLTQSSVQWVPVFFFFAGAWL